MNAAGRRVRLVSMPGAETFDAQTPRTARACCRAPYARLAVEAGATQSWWRYWATPAGARHDRFGASARQPDVVRTSASRREYRATDTPTAGGHERNANQGRHQRLWTHRRNVLRALYESKRTGQLQIVALKICATPRPTRTDATTPSRQVPREVQVDGDYMW